MAFTFLYCARCFSVLPCWGWTVVSPCQSILSPEKFVWATRLKQSKIKQKHSIVIGEKKKQPKTSRFCINLCCLIRLSAESTTLCMFIALICIMLMNQWSASSCPSTCRTWLSASAWGKVTCILHIHANLDCPCLSQWVIQGASTESSFGVPLLCGWLLLGKACGPGFC